MSLSAPLSLSPATLPQVRRDLPDTPPSRSPSPGSVPINDITVGMQWLGAFAGTPSIVVRTQGCDVGCGYCNVRETWHPVDRVLHPRFKKHIVRWRHLLGEDIASWCRLNYRQRHVVVSGGEPAMHSGIGGVCQTLMQAGYRVQLETSGTHELTVPDRVWLTVSPKFAMAGKRDICQSVLRRANEIVYPVSRRSDFQRLAQLVIPHIASTARVYLHPITRGTMDVAVMQVAFSQGYMVARGHDGD